MTRKKEILDKITNTSKGMPDCWHIDSTTGRSSPEVVQKHFGLPRSYRNDKNILNFLLVKEKRIRHFVRATIHYRHLEANIFLLGDKGPSPEAHAMERFDPGWHLKNENELIEVTKLDKDDLQKKIFDLTTVRNSRSHLKSTEEKIKEIANRTNTTLDHAYETIFKCAIETWLKAKNRLKDWKNLNHSEKEQLSEVLFCGFTFFGKPALTEILDIEPEVFGFYTNFLGEKKDSVHQAKSSESNELVKIETPAEVINKTFDSKKIDGKTKRAEANSHIDKLRAVGEDLKSSDINKPTNLKELYALIGEICINAKDSNASSSMPGKEVLKLMDEYFEKLSALSIKWNPEEVKNLIVQFQDEVLRSTQTLRFEESSLNELVPALRSAWSKEIISALSEGRTRSWFEVNLADRRYLPEISEKFSERKKTIEEAQQKLKAIQEELLQAKFTARAALKAKETHEINKINLAHQELETIRVDAAHLLVPEGRSLDDVMDDSSIFEDQEIDFQKMNSESLNDLKSLVLGFEILTERIINKQEIKDLLVQDIAEIKSNSPLSIIEEQSSQGSIEEYQASSQPKENEDTGFIEKSDYETNNAFEIKENVDAEEDQINLESSNVITVDEALKHLRWSESKEDALQAFRIAHDQFYQIPAYIVESIAMHWIEVGHLNVAAHILRDANLSTIVKERVLDHSLLRSAFYGLNFWPRDSESLSSSQRDLNLINHKDLEDQLERKPTGKLVPYLIVCATLQPALFASGQTQAPTLLRFASNHFDQHLQRLIQITSEFTLRGGRLDLDLLRNEKGQEIHKLASKLQADLNNWIELNQKRSKRWHALRIALRKCRNIPIIAAAITAINEGEAGDAYSVRKFVESYSTHAESRRLLDELVEEIRSDATFNENIDNQAYITFCYQIDILIGIANTWLLEVAPNEIRPKEFQEFLQKFNTLLERSIHTLEDHPSHEDLEHRAGSSLLLNTLQKLQYEINTDAHKTWKYDQTDATYHLPATLANLDLGYVGAEFNLEWYAMRLTSPNWLNDMLALAKRHESHWVRLLLLRQKEKNGNLFSVEIDLVTADIAGSRAELKKQIEHFRNLSLQAMSVDLIGEIDHLTNMDQISDCLEQLTNRNPYVDTTDIKNVIDDRIKLIERLLNANASSLQEELDRELLNIRVKLGQDAVPQGWDLKAKNAIDKKSLSLVRELINQLKEHSAKNTRLQETSLIDNIELSTFLKVEDDLYSVLNEHLNPREAADRVLQETPGGLDYSLHKTEFKHAIETLLEWRKKGKNKKVALDKSTYESIVFILNFIGLEVNEKIGVADVLKSCEYSPSGDCRKLNVRISRPILPKGFPIFDGEIGSGQLLNIIFVQGDWNLAGLVDLIERQGQPERAVLIVGDPLSPEERRVFSAFCSERKCTIFLIDPVLLSYIATSPYQQLKFEYFLKVSATWTFYNPYTKRDARLPAPPEMRFGRESDIASLVEPRGAALVYGGRQLGKTTLLTAAVQEFKKRDPLHNHAYYVAMDGVFQFVTERNIQLKQRLFDLLVSRLVEDKVLIITSSNSHLDSEERLRHEFLRAGSSKVLFCLDEIDPVLNKDAATNFELVRSLKALVNDPHHRFRVVFAGLNNVNRFRDYPNVPLEQLGSPLSVSILNSQEARSLILQPLSALGYIFSEPELVDRIMAFTNRHPSLLHIFCSELVEQLGKERSRSNGTRTILQTDIENIENNSEVRKLSGDRFDMTLNLDKRYTIVIYGLLFEQEKSLDKFTVSKALDVARTWVPEEFQQMSESGFESILLELVGLGVLIEDKDKRLYSLRNQSILQLIGSMDDIQHKLQVAINGLKDHEQDVLTCHAISAGQIRIPSPLTLQDERVILNARSTEGASNYSVSLVMGSSALGLNLKSIQEAFNSINDFTRGPIEKYETHLFPDAATVDLNKFSERIKTAIDNWSLVNPAVVIISLEECTSIDRVLDLIGIANEMAVKASRLKHSLRLIFLFGPKVMWLWISHSWLTTSPEEIGGQVDMNRWTRAACQNLLDQSGLTSTTNEGQLLLDATEGWYEYLLKFIDVCSKKKENVSNFGQLKFTGLLSLPIKELDKFIGSTGMKSIDWSMPLASKLWELDPAALKGFNINDIEAAISLMCEEHQHLAITPDQAESVIRWWTSLRVIEANSANTREIEKSNAVTFRFVKSIQRAIELSSSFISEA
jgi:hypothetical protein